MDKPFHTGELIKDMRKKRGVTQKELAVMLGVGISRVQQIEHRSNCYFSTLVEVAQELGFEIHVTRAED